MDSFYICKTWELYLFIHHDKMGEIPLITDALEGDIANIYNELREQPALEESRT